MATPPAIEDRGGDGPAWPRAFGLDLVRAIAICTVLHFHGFFYFDHLVEPQVWQLPVLIDGVSLFFVLSGFLIGRILFDHMAAGRLRTGGDLLRFWQRRWWRTLPAYFFMLSLLVAIFLLTGKELPARLWQYLFFTQNLSWPHPRFFAEAWSLSAEEWFYVLLPFALLAVARSPQRRKAMLSWIVIMIFLLVPLVLRHLRFQAGIGLEQIEFNYRMIVLYRFDSLMIGVAGAWFAVHARELWSKHARPMLCLGLALLVGLKANAVAFGHSMWFETVALQSVEALGVVLCFPFLSAWQPRKSNAAARSITWIATVSYSMYLVNGTFVQWTVMGELPGWLKGEPQETWRLSLIPLVVFWLLTLVFSVLLYYGFEKRMTAMRDRSWLRRNSTG
ncbi:MAG: acyltransferase [Flavobacteriales bacterium]